MARQQPRQLWDLSKLDKSRSSNGRWMWCFRLAWVVGFICAVTCGADLYVAPNGSVAGPGTVGQPYSLEAALSGSVGRAGDTFWLAGGRYCIGHTTTQIHGSAGRPVTLRSVAGQRVQVIGSLTFWGKAGYVILRDFEICSGVTGRVSHSMRADFNPGDLTNFYEGIQVYSPNLSFINLVVHDSVRSGFYTSAEATNALIYGCIVYNCGWASPDTAEGHSFYLQGSGEYGDNIAFNSVGANFHVYANGSGHCLENIKLDGNVAFGAGTLQTVRPSRDWIVGVDKPALKADRITLSNNLGFPVANPTTLTEVQVGREQINGCVMLLSNYWPQGLVLKNWRQAIVTGNLVGPAHSGSSVELKQDLTKLHAEWNRNCYVNSSKGGGLRLNSKSCTSGSVGELKGTKIFVRPNRYTPGRANIIVYNWDKRECVPVNVSGVLSRGATYEVRNAQDFFGNPVLSGTFDGNDLQLPMTGLTVAKPPAPLKQPVPTGPQFNVFVLLPKPT